MLVSLEIKNFLLIKKISINFIIGFNAFTGETGAGKSIIIEGLKLALGGKNQTNLNLKENEISSIKAVFEINNLIKKNLDELNLIIEDDYRKSNDNQKQRYFYPLNQETNFKINKFFRTITKDKNQSKITVNVKGRNFKIENFYEGIVRFNFNGLCDQNLGAEDYLEII